MGILFQCTQCERPLNVQSQFAGVKGVCPNCHETIAVPIESEMFADEFRERLKEWHHRPEEWGEGPDSAAIRKPGQPPSTSSIRMDVPRESQSMAQGRGISPVEPGTHSDESSVRPVLTESRKVAEGILNSENAQQFDVEGVHGNRLWYVRPPSGGQFGPASPQLMESWMHEGRVTGDSYIWCEAWDDWQLAGRVFPKLEDAVQETDVQMGNQNAVVAARTRTAYMKARQRRTMWSIIGILTGILLVVVLLVVLFIIVSR